MKIVWLSNKPIDGLFLFKHTLELLGGDFINIAHVDFDDNPIPWEEIHKEGYDLGINYLGTRKIPPSEFQKPFKFVNFHPAPLPEYKGRNLAYHAIIEGAKEFGATIHYMDKEFDTGELIEVKRFPIEPWHTSGDLVRISHQFLKELFIKWIPELLKGKVPSTPQKREGNYYKKTLLCEEVDISDTARLSIRALTCHPKYHARLTIGGKKYKIIPEEE